MTFNSIRNLIFLLNEFFVITQDFVDFKVEGNFLGFKVRAPSFESFL